jgi:hypothetical protein
MPEGRLSDLMRLSSYCFWTGADDILREATRCLADLLGKVKERQVQVRQVLVIDLVQVRDDKTCGIPGRRLSFEQACRNTTRARSSVVAAFFPAY